MKKILLVFYVLLPLLAGAQPQFTHVVIIVQENRTPDNLFCASDLAGIDVECSTQGIPVPLASGSNPGHKHRDFENEARGRYQKGTFDYVASGADQYWQMAGDYSFANRMFQTNQGDSYPAHQFLVSGTSAPSDASPFFVSDRAKGSMGCAHPTPAPMVDDEGDAGTTPACFDRSSLMTLLDAAGLTWKYYSPPTQGGLWNAPLSLTSYYKSKNLVYRPPQVLTDIANGDLANVVWVIPAATYSDHPDDHSTGGPAWVSSIVNAVGNSSYWQDTAIIVTWDDWGGFWDHVRPTSNGDGWCTTLCYGFRVPLLVISAYTPPGYVDNEVHDFGSILHFVENNFALSQIGPGGWADAWADNLAGFFSASPTPRSFARIKSRKMTKRELEDQGAPDTD